MKIGAHVSTRMPFSEAVNRANEIGCECMQIFANPPQRWNPVPIADSEIKKFVELNNKYDIKPVIIHGIYLLNLASENPFYYEASIKSLIDDMQKAEKLGAVGVNFHVGSTKGNEFSSVLKKIVEAINKILENSPEGPYLILENSAGAGNIIGDIN
ncbi:MAG: TIM barrel protein, partial [Patescibacteria group bacterium]|nr:TIM barrel protein [Patescibacteria group bacterium]